MKFTNSFFLFLFLLTGLNPELKAIIDPVKPDAIIAVCNESVNVALGVSGSVTILPEFIDDGSADTGGPITSMSVSPDLFDCSDVGQSFTVTLTVTGPSGTISCFSTVFIEDKTPPTAVCESDIFINLPPVGIVTLDPSLVDAGSIDNCAGALTRSLSQTSFDCIDLGSSAIALTVTDESGNSNTCFSIVHVQDLIPPTAICESDIFINLPPSGDAVVLDPAFVGVGSEDNCGGALTQSLSQTSFDCSDLGSSVISLTVTDESGNSNSCFSIVHVQDLVSPNAVCVNEISIALLPNGTALLFPADIDAGSFDNCGSGSLSFASGQTTYDCNDIDQVFVVTLRVTDAGGLFNDCLTEVYVVDNAIDDDCDGVSNACDLCPGGDDAVDNNDDGLPDCAFPPVFGAIIPAWKCGSAKVFICKKNSTKCISKNALAAQIANGAFLGPCGNASCDDLKGGNSGSNARFDQTFDEGLDVVLSGNVLRVGLESIDGGGNLHVFDALGRMITETTIGLYEEVIEIELPQLTAGLYIVNYRHEGVSISHKFIIGL